MASELSMCCSQSSATSLQRSFSETPIGIDSSSRRMSRDVASDKWNVLLSKEDKTYLQQRAEIRTRSYFRQSTMVRLSNSFDFRHCLKSERKCLVFGQSENQTVSNGCQLVAKWSDFGHMTSLDCFRFKKKLYIKWSSLVSQVGSFGFWTYNLSRFQYNSDFGRWDFGPLLYLI